MESNGEDIKQRLRKWRAEMKYMINIGRQLSTIMTYAFQPASGFAPFLKT
jgi:hypothetical protein